LIFLPFIIPFANLMQGTSSSLPRQIANSHTVFNIAVSVLLFPFVKPIANTVKRLVPVKPEEENGKKTAYIDEKQYAVPSVAITEANRELVRMGGIAAEMVALSCEALIERDMDKAERVLAMEDEMVDPITHELDHFVSTLMQADLSHLQQSRVFQVKNLLVDVERVGDMAEDIAQFAQDRVISDISFSDEAIAEFDFLWHFVHANFVQSLQALNDKDHDLAGKVCEVESEFDSLYLKARQNHIRRLEAGTCRAQADVIYTETLRLLERISDHADNLGVSVMRN